ncbi:hypothetical protein [Kibdelosporangium philippinense]
MPSGRVPLDSLRASPAYLPAAARAARSLLGRRVESAKSPSMDHAWLP